MADLESKIHTLLAGTAGVSGIASTRIRPIVLNQGDTLPALTYQRVSGGQQNVLSGSFSLENPRIQIDCMASTYSGAKALGAAVLTAMTGATTFTALLISDQDIYEDVAECYRVSMDFSVWHKIT
jgi:hypothetical protein